MTDPTASAGQNPLANSASRVRRHNRRVLLHALRVHGPLSRAELARATGLTPQGVNNIVEDLIGSGLVRIAGRRKSPRGQPPIAIEIANDGGYAVGVRVDATHYHAVAADLGGTLIESEEGTIPVGAVGNWLDFVAGIHAGFAARFGADRCLGIGLVTPGPFDIDWPGVPTPGAVPALQRRSVAEELAQLTGTDVLLENDATAAALGERLYGAGRDFRDFYYLYFGVGLGGSMVHDGAALRGAWGNAGEIGHMPVMPDGDPCPCGNRGCLERYVSLEAWERRSRVIGEPAWIAEVAPLFRTALVTIENLFDPETIVVGGLAPKRLLQRLAEAAAPLPNSVAARQDRRAPRITLSPVGQDAVLLGAAALAVSGVLSPRFGLMFADGPRRPPHDPLVEAAGASPA